MNKIAKISSFSIVFLIIFYLGYYSEKSDHFYLLDKSNYSESDFKNDNEVKLKLSLADAVRAENDFLIIKGIHTEIDKIKNLLENPPKLNETETSNQIFL